MLLLTMTTLLVAGVEVQVRPLAGESLRGEVVSLSPTELVVATAEGQKAFAVPDLLEVRALADPAPSEFKAAVWLQLVDGSTLQGIGYRSVKGKGYLQQAGAEWEIPAAIIEHVRFREQDAALQAQWRSIVEDEHPGDTIVIRKTSAKPQADESQPVETVAALDFLEGVLFDVSADKVQFKFDGSTIDVSRDKVEGIIYFHPAGSALAKALCRVRDADGNVWNARAVEHRDGRYEIVSQAGMKASLSPDALRTLDFSLGKVLFLGDLKPESVKWSSYVDSQRVAPRLAAWFVPTIDRSQKGISDRELRAGGKLFERGIALHSRTEMVFALPEGYRKLLGEAGIDDRMRPGGQARLELQGDGKSLFSADLSGADGANVVLEQEIAGVKRLRVIVDFGDLSDASDYVILGDIRITK